MIHSFHRSLLVVAFVFCGALLAVAQTYQPLRCKGPIPQDFRTLSITKFEKDKSKEESANTRERKSKEEFLLKTNYLIDDLLLSGKVLFGDSVTQYVNEVADRVLADQPELRAKLRFYCLKSPQANAFCTDQGIVFVTLGLLAQLENEAQLAFVLSHEIAHYEKRHTMNSYLEQEEIFSNNQQYKYNSYEDRISRASQYSKNLELEADSLGLKRLSRTSYDCEQAVTSLFVLQYSYLPFNEIEFSANIFENSAMKFPAPFMLDTVAPVDFSGDEEDDTYSTHPNMAKRRKFLEAQMKRTSSGSQNKFASGEAYFNRIQQIAREEVIHLQLLNRNYLDAFYNAYVLQKTSSEVQIATVFMAKALYGLAKYKNAGEYSSVTESYYKIEGESQRSAYLFGHFNDQQLNLVALRFLFDAARKYPSPTLNAMRDDLCKELYLKHQIGYDELVAAQRLYDEAKSKPVDSTKVKEQQTQTNATNSSDNKTYVSKYDKLRKDKREREIEQLQSSAKEEFKFQLLAFSDILQDPEVIDLFGRAKAQAAEEEADSEKAMKELSEFDRRKLEHERSKRQRIGKAPNLGIDSVVFVDPFYFEVDERKGLKLVKSEAKLLEFSQQIRENAQYADLNIQVLDPKTFGENEVDRFNDMAAMNDWVGERLDHDDLDIIPLESEYVDTLAKKYGTDYFCYTGVFSYKQHRDNRWIVVLYTAVYLPALPFGLYYALTPVYETSYYTLMYNVKMGQQMLNHRITIKSKSKRGYIDSQMYDVMARIKNKPKSDKKK